MCGIAGYIGEEKLSRAVICRALGKMEHRGPDCSDYGEFKTKNGKYVFLLHTRLAVIGLDERSSQPFEIGPKTLVHNGEIYNYFEIRKNLEKKGVVFAAESDTEVLIRSLLENGIAALDYMEGMWAFACYDKSEETLLLSRDRFGKKPLYLYKCGTGLYFASEPKAIFEMLGRTLPVNHGHFLRYMINGYKSLHKTGETFFLGLNEVPPGTVLKIKSSGLTERIKYWNPAFGVRKKMSFSEAAEGAREHLLRSVEFRLRSDVPVAFCMSGGIDSNSLICSTKKQFNYDVHAFTVWNHDKQCEEQ